MGIFAGIVSFATALIGTGVFDKAGKNDLEAYKTALAAQEKQISRLKIIAFLFVGISLLLGVIIIFKFRKK